MSVPGDTKLPDSNTDQQQLAEAREIVAQSPDAALGSAPVSDVAGLKEADIVVRAFVNGGSYSGDGVTSVLWCRLHIVAVSATRIKRCRPAR